MGSSIYLVIIGMGILFWVLTCLAVYDLTRKNFSSLQVKALWGVISMVPFIGCLIYFIFGSSKGTLKRQGNT